MKRCGLRRSVARAKARSPGGAVIGATLSPEGDRGDHAKQGPCTQWEKSFDCTADRPTRPRGQTRPRPWPAADPASGETFGLTDHPFIQSPKLGTLAEFVDRAGHERMVISKFASFSDYYPGVNRCIGVRAESQCSRRETLTPAWSLPTDSKPNALAGKIRFRWAGNSCRRVGLPA
jgi:hypothetical protein